MKICIWCSKNEDHVTFEKLAHTIPQSLGGKLVCENVCDSCNEFFGRKEHGLPAVEIALKEVLNTSKYLLLTQHKEIRLSRFKSEYFNFNYKSNPRTFKFKMGYKLRPNFQREFGRRFRRGIYKVFLEERERQIGDAHDERFNFMREFSRFDLNDYPVYVQVPKFKAILYNTEDLLIPQIRFTDHSDEMDKEFRFYSYPLMGHSFVIPTSSQFMDERLSAYIKYLRKTEDPFGSELISLDNIEQLDFRFNYMNGK
ncbi:hypothetical protein J2795_002998 [Chryseobacterium bernardetii]|uniref:Uncharacterized protein n=1 Tax=Chryseobacterium bernardetii TaxID=1241978 RepID=A0ACC6IWZ5_9FLAO|nr:MULTISPECIES: HNH endonuclease [Chryseobacterium]MDR6372343.1 hypothetical protein [Chryseobacterium vietnamense]MDR6442273.1 hypothetical protein [Chryseobacterium bernardetii]